MSENFSVPPGYRIIPEDLYNTLMANLHSKPLGGVEKSEATQVYQVIRDVYLGDIRTKLTEGETLIYADNEYVRIRGKKYDILGSFMIFLNAKNSPFMPVSQEEVVSKKAMVADEVRVKREENQEPSLTEVSLFNLTPEQKKEFIRDHGGDRLEEISRRSADGTYTLGVPEKVGDIRVNSAVDPEVQGQIVARIAGKPADERVLTDREIQEQAAVARAKVRIQTK